MLFSQLMTAFMVGLLGSLHCIGMCGGIVGMLSNVQLEKGDSTEHRQVVRWVAYNSGRLISYMMAGGVVGFLGSQVLDLLTAQRAHDIGLMIAGVFMMMMGLSIAGWWQGIRIFEKLGGHLWRKIAPKTQTLLQPRTFYGALKLGLVWGWLPCGLVYSTLAWSMVSGSSLKGALLMLSFGLGTLPMLALMGFGANRLGRFSIKPWMRMAAGITIILLGVLIYFGVVMPFHASIMHHNH